MRRQALARILWEDRKPLGGLLNNSDDMGYPFGACDGKPGNRHSLYRFHIMDPIRFAKDLRVTMQAIGWRTENRYLPLQDDISSVAYWYQADPHHAFPPTPSRDQVEIV